MPMAPPILNLSTIRWVGSFTPRPLDRQKTTQCPLNGRLVRPHSHSGRSGKEQNSYSCPDMNPGSSNWWRSQYTYYTALAGLRETWLKSTAFFCLNSKSKSESASYGHSKWWHDTLKGSSVFEVVQKLIRLISMSGPRGQRL